MVRRTEDAPAGADPTLADDFLKDGWQRTIEDMRAMAEDREGRGFETLTLASGDTTPISPSMGDDDRFGFSHLIPGDEADAFRDLYAGNDFEETGVYQSGDSGHVFMVTEHVDYDDEVVIYIAGAYRMADAAPLVRAAIDRGKLHTYVRLLDRTNLGTFEHTDVDAFFPNPELYYSYEPGR
jgi:hypothetical protein